MSKKQIAIPSKELERIHVSEYLDLVYEGEDPLLRKDLYTLVAAKHICMGFIGNNKTIYMLDIRKGQKGGKVSGPHNLLISPESKDNQIWIEKDSYVIDDAVVSKGYICGGSVIQDNAKVECERLEGVQIGRNISLKCTHNIKALYCLVNHYTDDIINLTDNDDILYIDGLRSINLFDRGITIFNPGNVNDPGYLITSQIISHTNTWYDTSDLDSKDYNCLYHRNVDSDDNFKMYKQNMIRYIYLLAEEFFKGQNT